MMKQVIVNKFQMRNNCGDATFAQSKLLINMLWFLTECLCCGTELFLSFRRFQLFSMTKEETSNIDETELYEWVNSAPVTLEIQLLRCANLCCLGDGSLDRRLAAVNV